MLLKDVLAGKGVEVQTISSEATLDEVVATLVKFNIGSLLVRNTADGPILGIITERDILCSVDANQAPLNEQRVAACMSRELTTARSEDDTTLAMGLMTTHRIRHLPVIDDDQLHGIVSIGDLVKAHHDELERENYQMLNYIQGGGSAVVIPPGDEI